MNLWPEVTLEEVYAEGSRNGLTRPKSVRGAGYPMINMGELFAHERIGAIEMERVQMSERELAAFSVLKGDLLFARQSLVAAGAGKCSIVKAVAEPTTFESHLIRIRLNEQKADPSFFFYYFLSPIGKGNVQSLVMQVAAAGIRGSELAKLRVPLPPLPMQQRIAGILSSYDELIENNQRRIRILEDMARSLYREWFVHFRYSGHESVPLVDSPLGQIPQGWEVKKLRDIAVVNRTQINAKTAPDELHYIDIASVSPGQIDYVTTYTFSDAPGRARRVVQHGDVLWSCVRPNRRSHALVMHPETNTIASTGFAVLTAKAVPYTFLYCATTTDDFVSYLTNNASGAAYPAVTATTFEKAELLIPSSALLTLFGESTIAMMEQAHTLQRQTANLRRTRDLLLPRLLSGQVALNEAEANV